MGGDGVPTPTYCNHVVIFVQITELALALRNVQLDFDAVKNKFGELIKVIDETTSK